MSDFHNPTPMGEPHPDHLFSQQGTEMENARSHELEEIREKIHHLEEKLSYLIAQIPGNFASKDRR